MEITINPRARFHDGTPITARDVAFTFHKFMTEGVPQFRLVYKGTTVKAIAPLTVRIELAKPGKEDMLSLFTLPIMPEKFWKYHKLSDPLSTPPLASGPYRITQWKMGQYIVYSRVKNYWAANLPVNRGALTSTLSVTITILMTTSPLKRLKLAHLISVWKTMPKTGRHAISVKTSTTITSLKKSRKTSRRRTRAGWH
ncbi:transport system periplasmic binding protein [Salmonella bongori]|nr:transport system periplasmic binding protein [Salmonella bongori]